MFPSPTIFSLSLADAYLFYVQIKLVNLSFHLNSILSLEFLKRALLKTRRKICAFNLGTECMKAVCAEALMF